ncbi:hypothetical protein KBD49_00340 [Myxococcota bacterium]|nr:hypothetical protein [Myxococcota bacterium]
METRTPCRFLQMSPVPICAAFDGGLRTPTEAELEHLCQSDRHPTCLLFRERVAREQRHVESGIREFADKAEDPPKT